MYLGKIRFQFQSMGEKSIGCIIKDENIDELLSICVHYREVKRKIGTEYPLLLTIHTDRENEEGLYTTFMIQDSNLPRNLIEFYEFLKGRRRR